MGPTVCELDGPIPTLNRSKALMVIGTPIGGYPGVHAGEEPLCP